jgi:hypothetical protein
MTSTKQTLKSALSLALITLFALTLAGCAQKNAAHLLQSGHNTPEGTTVLAVYEAWFGEGDHIDVGYSCHDKVVLAKQVEQAQNMGITGFVVDWYGTSKPFIDGSFAAMQQVSAEKNFKVALMYDEIDDDASRMTENAISHLDYAYQQYIGPNAPQHTAYLTYNGRPLIFIWPRGSKTDWARVREHLNTWAQPPLLIFKDEPTKFGNLFDGRYAWIHAGKGGFKPDGSDWGEDYLQNFYSKMSAQHDGKIIVGAAWAGFDDSRAAWSENRYMANRCGKTFEETLHYPRRYFSSSNPLPFLLIATWNDHEEGTGIERGIAKVPPSKRVQTASCNGD